MEARLLSDGESTLIDKLIVSPDEKTWTHSAILQSGFASFLPYSNLIPLSLGDPNPPDRDLGTSLGNLLAEDDVATLVEHDQSAHLDDRAVVRLVLDFPQSTENLRITY